MQKTTEEKIDYIYEHIKKEEKTIFWRRVFKIGMYLFFILYLAYFYFFGFENLKNKIIESIKPNINSENIVEGLKDNSGEIIDKIKKSDILNKFYEKKKLEESNDIY